MKHTNGKCSVVKAVIIFDVGAQCYIYSKLRIEVITFASFVNTYAYIHTYLIRSFVRSLICIFQFSGDEVSKYTWTDKDGHEDKIKIRVNKHSEISDANIQQILGAYTLSCSAIKKRRKVDTFKQSAAEAAEAAKTAADSAATARDVAKCVCVRARVSE